MADNKISFVLYCDIISTVEKLSNEKAGKLFKIILDYVNDKNPVIKDVLLQIAFEPIKQSLKRDLKKWEQFIERQKVNGQKGGRPKEPKKTQKTQAFFEKPKKPVSVLVLDSVLVKEEEMLFTLWTEIKKLFFNDYIWKEKFCRDKNLSLPKLEILQKEFISDIELKEDFKELKELKSHFTNWFNLRSKNGVPAAGAEQLHPRLKNITGLQ